DRGSDHQFRAAPFLIWPADVSVSLGVRLCTFSSLSLRRFLNLSDNSGFIDSLLDCTSFNLDFESLDLARCRPALRFQRTCLPVSSWLVLWRAICALAF